jgi:hypothetical protein
LYGCPPAAVTGTAATYLEPLMTIRLLAAGACALFLVACTAKDDTTSTGTTPGATAATHSKAVFELGRPI